MAIFNSYVKLPEGIHLHSKGTIFFRGFEDQQRQFVEYPLAQEPAQPQESKERTFGRSLEMGYTVYTKKWLFDRWSDDNQKILRVSYFQTHRFAYCRKPYRWSHRRTPLYLDLKQNKQTAFSVNFP